MQDLLVSLVTASPGRGLGAVSQFGQMCDPSCGTGCAAEDDSQYPYLASSLTKLSKQLISFSVFPALGKCSSPGFAEEWCRLTFGQVTWKAVAELGTNPRL